MNLEKEKFEPLVFSDDDILTYSADVVFPKKIDTRGEIYKNQNQN